MLVILRCRFQSGKNPIYYSHTYRSSMDSVGYTRANTQKSSTRQGEENDTFTAHFFALISRCIRKQIDGTCSYLGKVSIPHKFMKVYVRQVQIHKGRGRLELPDNSIEKRNQEQSYVYIQSRM